MKTRSTRGAAGKNAVLVVVALVIFAVAGYLTYRQVAGPRTPEKTMTLCCEACNQVFRDQPMGELPRECPACKKKALRLARQCYRCGHLFAESLATAGGEGSPLEPALPKCPKCHSTDIGEPRQTGAKAD